MKKVSLSVLLGSLLLTPIAAMAATGSGSASINVNADVNSAISMLSANGTPLTDITLAYAPGVGLHAGGESVVVASNSTADGVDITTSGTFVLTNGSDASVVPMSASLGGNALSAIAYHIKSTELVNGQTAPMQLDIKPTSDTKTLTTGHYSGVLNLSLVQAVDKAK